MNSDTTDRPLEPNNRGEDPEGWAELVDWEADRADRLERELTAARAEIARLQAGGCARNQRLTQYCQEAVDAQARVKELLEDKARLDWLDENIHSVIGYGRQERWSFMAPFRDNLRAAIDAARKSS